MNPTRAGQGTDDYNHRMTDERYLLAAFLPEAERDALRREAGEDPRALDLIRASEALHAFIGEADELLSDASSESALAFLAASRISPGPRAPEWSALLERLEAEVNRRPEARAKYEELFDRIWSLEAGSDAEAHFRRLSGPDPPRVVRLRPLLAAAAAIAAVAIAGILGRALEDPVARAAHESLVRSSRSAFRGASAEGTAYGSAVRARHVILGLWPSYDRKVLESIDREMSEPDSAYAWLLAGQVRLMLGDCDGASVALRRARDLGLGVEATSLLERIDD